MSDAALPLSYDRVIFQALTFEFGFDDPKVTDRKIKRRLRYRQLESFSQDRVDILRRLKNLLQNEINLHGHSKYYRGGSGRFSASDVFDVPRLVDDYHQLFPSIALDDLEWFVKFAILNYELR